MNKGIAAVVIFSALMAFPVAYNGAASVAGLGSGSPKLAEGKGKDCVRPEDWMRKNHMSLLKHVREDAVRQGHPAGDTGLRGCISCHPNRAQFCDSCHSYVGASPECWHCHHYPS